MLRDSERRQLADRNTVLAAHVDAELAALVGRLRQMEAGTRSPVGDGGRGKGGHGDPTFAQAMSDTVDPAARDLARLDVILAQSNRMLEEANTLRLRYLHPQDFTTKARRDEGCESCAAHGRHEDVFRTGDVAGRLTRHVALGRWCYEFVVAAGCLPADWQVIDHHEGRRVKLDRAEVTRAELDVDHRLTVTVRAHHPRTTLADAMGDVGRALDVAGVDATVKRNRSGKKRKG